MDTKGKILNGAFSVVGAYVIGAQLDYISSVVSYSYVMIYVITKLTAEILAVIVAWLFF